MGPKDPYLVYGFVRENTYKELEYPFTFSFFNSIVFLDLRLQNERGEHHILFQSSSGYSTLSSACRPTA